jgi:hypothetical protein
MRILPAFAVLLFALPAPAVDIDWVKVGNRGNACDPQSQGCFGAVDYVYQIGKYEVTNAQYVEFLNAVAATDTNGLYDTRMGDLGGLTHGSGITRSGSSGSYTYTAIAGREDMPVNYVSFYHALRFANWLNNGQPTGAQDSTTTEDGAYTMITESYPDGPLITRNADAKIFLPSENEWYKAAYYDGASYFDYAAGTDTPPTCASPGATPNTANCWPAVQDLTDVGSYTGSASSYGTFDQGGNVWERTEAKSGMYRIIRGGSFKDGNPAYYLAAATRAITILGGTDYHGFRVAMISECDDGFDNDEDGLIDYPSDPDCLDYVDLSEQPDCMDGLDNDEDGLVDYPSERAGYGCTWWDDPSEMPQCSDGLDNDLDGDIDYPADPQCMSASWTAEFDQIAPYCGLGIELVLVVAPLIWMWRRRNRRV